LGSLVLLASGAFVACLAAAEPANWDEAEELAWRGRYEEAAALYEPQAGKDTAAAIGLAHCRIATGDREAAIQLLRAACERDAKSAESRAELALVCLDSGASEEAAKFAAAAIERDKDSLPARWVQAELLGQSGKLAEAQKAYEWFVDYYNRGPKVDRVRDLRWIGLAAAELARWTRNSNQFRQLVSDFYPAALRREPNFWPAHLDTALLFAEKYNTPDAAAELSAALTINPNSAVVHAARAELALYSFDLAAAKGSLERALEINPQLVWAHQLRADVLFADVRPGEAIAVLDEARELNPRDEATLGRLAAAYAAQDGMPSGEPSVRMQKLIAEVTARNPHCGKFYLALADACDRMRRFPLAERYYRAASAAMPQLISVRGKLGLTLMRLGEEAEAAKLLDAAFTIDPFNVRVKNTLEVLDLLKDYAVLETEHFVLKFDRGHDGLLARYAAKYLEEEVFPQLVQEFGFKPPGKTLIEIFSRGRNTSGHGWFSARMVGLPFIGTVGACAGKMIALSSPSEIPQKYNWGHVLRHEYVHVINLQQTDFHVPHWLTEGLAVHSEDQPRPADWNALLAKRAAADKLFNLDTITLGFIRPQEQDDWTLAYCQAELYFDYVLATYGEDATARMLAAYGRHLSTPEVLQACFGATQAEFEKGYRDFLQTIVEAELAVTTTSHSFSQLQRAAEEKPQDAAAAGRLARAYLARNSNPQARRWALAAKKLNPHEPLAAYVLARLQLSIGDSAQAIELLAAALGDDDAKDEHPPEEPLALLAALKLQAGELEQAEKLHLRGAALFPNSDRWPKGLARIYLQTKRPDKLEPVLVKLALLDADSLPIRQKLAQLALARDDFTAARKWARECLFHDVQDAPTHALLAAAALGQNKLATAVDEYETAISLDGTQVAWRSGLVQALVKQGEKAKARAALDELRELDADYPGLDDLEKSLEP
jgi:predicted Zn-dependent protease